MFSQRPRRRIAAFTAAAMLWAWLLPLAANALGDSRSAVLGAICSAGSVLRASTSADGVTTTSTSAPNLPSSEQAIEVCPYCQLHVFNIDLPSATVQIRHVEGSDVPSLPPAIAVVGFRSTASPPPSHAPPCCG